MHDAYDFDRSELEWRAARAVVEPWRWLACTVVARVLSAGDRGLSVAAWCRECAEPDMGGDPYAPFALLDAVADAATSTGLELPWEQRSEECDRVLVLTDPDAAKRLLSAMHCASAIDHLIEHAGDGNEP